MKPKPAENPFVEALLQGLVKPPASPAAAAAKWDRLFNQDLAGADWDVSGIFTYDEILLRLFDAIYKVTGRRLFTTVHGLPLCIWNGGRPSQLSRKSPGDYDALMRDYAGRGIAVELTATNYNIDAAALQDPMGNAMLFLASKYNPTGRNGVIVCEEVMVAHVRKTHPDLKLIASVVKVVKEDGRGRLDYYLDLEKRFDKIMVHPDDVVNPDLLRQLEHKDKYALLINEPCIRNCQVRKRHYQIVSDSVTNILDPTFGEKEWALTVQNGCKNLENLLLAEENRTLVLSSAEIKGLYDLGFRHFKIQGRGMRSEYAMILELYRVLFNHNPHMDHFIGRLMQAVMPACQPPER